MRRLVLFSLLLLLTAPLAAQRNRSIFSSSKPRPYYYTPKPTPSVFGPRIVEIGHRYTGAGRRGPASYGYRPGYGHGYGHGYRGHRRYDYRRGYGYGYKRGYADYYPGQYRSPYLEHPFGRYGRTGVYRFFVTSPTGGTLVRANSADLVIDVKPARAMIFIDSKLVGSGRDFARDQEGYPLMEGVYELRVEHPGFEPFTTDLQIVPNRTVHLDLELTPRGERD